MKKYRYLFSLVLLWAVAMPMFSQPNVDEDSINYPLDVTNKYIVNSNPSEASIDGWIVYDDKGTPRTTWSVVSKKVGEWWVGELWNVGGYSIKQTITIPAGVYTLRSICLTRTDMKSFLFAGNFKTQISTVPSHVVDNLTAAAEWFNSGNGVSDVTWIQKEEGDIEIGLIADNSSYGDHWTAWRNFELFDLGNKLDSYLEAITFLTQDSWTNEFDNSIFTDLYYTAAEKVIEEARKQTCSTIEEAMAVYDNVLSTLQTLRENINHYNKIQNMLAKDGNIYDRYSSIGATKFDEFASVWEEANNLFKDNIYTKSNEDLADLITRYMMAREDLIMEITLPGCSLDVIVNPNFRDESGLHSGFAGWNVNGTLGFQNNSGSLPVVEQWNGSSSMGTIDISQEINITKPGVYRLETKGWYLSSNIYEQHEMPGYNTVNAYIYLGEKKSLFHDIYEHLYTPVEKQQYFPSGNCIDPYSDNSTMYRVYEKRNLGTENEESDENFVQRLTDNGVNFVIPWNAAGACELFDSPNVDWYNMACDFWVQEKNSKVEIGIYGEEIPPSAWLMWNDFKLTYLGVDYYSLKNYINATDLIGHTGRRINLPISLTNENIISGFQMDLVLPEGVEIATDKDNEYLVELTDRTKELMVSVSKKQEGLYGIVVMSLAGKDISGNKGQILNITLKIDEQMVASDYEYNLQNIRLTVKDSLNNNFTTATPCDVKHILTVNDGVFGDVNNDGEVNVTDAILVVHYILEQNPIGFVEIVADVNNDGIINITDAISIVNIILSDELTTAKGWFANSNLTANDRLSLIQDENGRYGLNLTNSGDYSGFQFDITLSEGMTINDVSLNSQRSTDHVVSYTRLHNGDYRVVALSFSGAAFRGNEGELASIKTAGNGNVMVKDVRFVTTDLQEVAFDVNTTGIEAIGNSQLTDGNAVYDLQGRKLGTSRPNIPGVYVVNGKKIVVK